MPDERFDAIRQHVYGCECTHHGCRRRIKLRILDYEADAKRGRIIHPECLNGDRVVRRAPGYVVVASSLAGVS